MANVEKVIKAFNEIPPSGLFIIEPDAAIMEFARTILPSPWSAVFAWKPSKSR